MAEDTLEQTLLKFQSELTKLSPMYRVVQKYGDESRSGTGVTIYRDDQTTLWGLEVIFESGVLYTPGELPNMALMSHDAFNRAISENDKVKGDYND